MRPPPLQHRPPTSLTLPTAALLLGLLLAPLLAATSWPAAPASAAAASCAGRPATLVGGPREIVGTEGADVIVSNGSVVVRGRGGDDLICVTGTRDPSYHLVDAGPGDDEVHGSPDGGAATIDLGPGEDTFVGGPGKESVDAVDDLDGALDEHDVVSTGAGDDDVSSGVYDGPSRDVIDLGAGDDALRLVGRSLDPSGSLVGGPGADRLQVGPVPTEGTDYADSLADADWVYRNTARTGSATADGATVLTWDGFEQFGLEGLNGSLRFYGGPADETVRTHDLDLAQLGAGDDRLVTWSLRPGRLRGGSGLDGVTLDCFGAASVDLGAGHYGCQGQGHATRSGLADFEDLDLTAVRASVRGSAGPDRIRLLACQGTVRGLGGADDLGVVARNVVFLTVDASCRRVRPRPIVLDGGRGPDRLRGATAPDVLLGGPGRDLADGRGGRDRCVAERRTGCEG